MSPKGLWWRALLALALAVGFYALALGIVAFCFAVSAALVLEGGRIPVKLVLLLVVASGITFWSILPRWDRFAPPGPRLVESEHPRLFSVLRAVASATRQPMPDEVFLVDDVNAFVANRGGILGLGSRPVMGIGLPLLQSLSIPEIKAVIAHEFGHYVGGDTKLGPLIYRTRGAIVRTLENLASAGSLLVYPFSAYLKLFLRVSHAVSRHQEFQAAQVGAQIGGAEALGSALRKVRSVGPAFSQYWQDEVLPVLAAGVMPPVASGFAHYVTVPTVSSAMAKIAESTRETSTDAYDTHPALGERLRAIGVDENQATSHYIASEPAIDLLGDVGSAEAALVRHLLRDDVPSPRPLSWIESADIVYPAQWDDVVDREPGLGSATLADVPEIFHSPARLRRMLRTAKVPSDTTEAVDFCRFVATIIIGRSFRASGYRVQSLPGEPLRLQRDGASASVNELVAAAASDDPDAWRARCAAFGVEASVAVEPAKTPL